MGSSTALFSAFSIAIPSATPDSYKEKRALEKRTLYTRTISKGSNIQHNKYKRGKLTRSTA